MFERFNSVLTVLYMGFQKVGTFFLLGLMPLYLFFIYLKLDDTNAMSYALVMTIIFVLYLPIQIIASEKDIPISFHIIYDDDDILKIIANAALFVIAFIVMFLHPDIGLLIIYLAWLILQIQLYLIFQQANIINKLKMLFVFVPIVIIISYSAISGLSSIAFSFNFESLFILIYLFIQLLFIMVILFPFVGLALVSRILIAISKTISNRVFGGLFKKDSSSYSSSKTEGYTSFGVFALLYFLIIGYIFIIHMTNSLIQSINPDDMAFYTVYGFIILSAIGGYFQFKIFWSYFFDDALSWVVTLVSLLIFIGILIVIVNTQELVEKRSILISESQKKLGEFYDKHR